MYREACNCYEFFLGIDPRGPVYYPELCKYLRKVYTTLHKKIPRYSAESMDLAGKWWEMKTAYDGICISKLWAKADGKPEKHRIQLMARINEIECNRRMVRGCLKEFYGIEPPKFLPAPINAEDSILYGFQL